MGVLGCCGGSSDLSHSGDSWTRSCQVVMLGTWSGCFSHPKIMSLVLKIISMCQVPPSGQSTLKIGYSFMQKVISLSFTSKPRLLTIIL